MLTALLFEIRFAIKLFTEQPVIGKYGEVREVHIAVPVEVAKVNKGKLICSHIYNVVVITIAIYGWNRPDSFTLVVCLVCSCAISDIPVVRAAAQTSPQLIK
ncbi:hypothetical protein ES703_64007 [subsurface metagenome]